jgi:hypothetical protein
MTFTVVRAVRGAESTLVEEGGKLPLLVKVSAPVRAGSRMDLPRVDDLLHLDFGAGPDFPETIPDPLD